MIMLGMEQNPETGHHYYTQYLYDAAGIPITLWEFILKITRGFLGKCLYMQQQHAQEKPRDMWGPIPAKFYTSGRCTY